MKYLPFATAQVTAPTRLVWWLATFLAILLAAPSAFLIAPQQTRAAPAGVPIVEIGANLFTNKITTAKTIANLIKSTISASANVATKISSGLLVVDRYVIQPLAFILSGNLLKAMTSSVVSFVIGQTNGTGAPQFVQNVSGLMQKVGDKQASVFLAQLARRPNSPFATAIASSLRVNYLQQTSAAGFFAANQSTLAQASPNINAFLNGDWSKGGVRAWFALTTQDQNNPYTLYQASRGQLSTLVGTAQAASTKQLDWGKGFLSWCGGSGSSESFDDDGNSLGASGPTPNCTQDDGSPGTIQTPGSYISETLSKAVGAAQDKLVAAGNAGKELNGILGSVATIMKTVNLASNLLGGISGSLGLSGAAQSSGADRSSLLGRYQTTPGYAGATAASVYQAAAELPSFGSELSDRITRYQTAWNTIAGAANNASSTVATFVRFCSSQGSVAAGVTTKIQSILAQAAIAVTTVERAAAAVQGVQDELTAATDTIGDTYTADAQRLQDMSPTISDVATAESDALLSGAVTADNASWIDTQNLSLVDQMDTVIKSVETLESSCLLGRVARYQAAWSIITAAADSAQGGINVLLGSCPEHAGAVAGFLTQIQGVRTQAAAAALTVAHAVSVAVQPQEADVVAAQAQARPSSVAGSPSLLDQMNIIIANVQTRQAECSASLVSSTNTVDQSNQSNLSN